MSWSTPTTFMKRFGDALKLLCGGHRPPEEMMLAWFDKTKDDNRLQGFCCDYGPDWAQGIVVINAAQVLADHPTEIRTPDNDIDHEHRPANSNVAINLQSRQRDHRYFLQVVDCVDMYKSYTRTDGPLGVRVEAAKKELEDLLGITTPKISSMQDPPLRAICPQCGKFRLVGGSHAGSTGFPCSGLKR